MDRPRPQGDCSHAGGEGIEGMAECYEGLPVESSHAKTIGLVLAGNIPLVGFHDMLSVLAAAIPSWPNPPPKMTGSSESVRDIICSLDPDMANRITIYR